MASPTSAPATAKPNYTLWLKRSTTDRVEVMPTVKNGFAGPNLDDNAFVPAESPVFVPKILEPHLDEVSCQILIKF